MGKRETGKALSKLVNGGEEVISNLRTADPLFGPADGAEKLIFVGKQRQVGRLIF